MPTFWSNLGLVPPEYAGSKQLHDRTRLAPTPPTFGKQMYNHMNKHEIMPRPRQNIKVFPAKHYKLFSSVSNNTVLI